MSNPLEALRDHLAPIEDLKAAAAVLRWDQETNMPDGGAEARAQQLSTLQSTAHERFGADETGELLDRAADAVSDTDPIDPNAALVRVTRRDYERAVRVPSALVAELSKAKSQAQQAWTQARQNDDFARFAPHLERLVELSVEKAEAIGYADEPYDALLTAYEPGRTTAEVEALFDTLRDDLIPLVDTIDDAPQVDDELLRGTYPQSAQQEFGRSVIEDFGYDFDRGRQDVSAHPFTTAFSPDDVRLTTRYDEANVASALFSTIHEAGHGLYEQGIAPSLARTPLGDGTALSTHESQARLWENHVGRSRSFWRHYLPQLQDHFPDALGDAALEPFYRAINRVAPSLIRVEADEVTYHLHVMLRFELERGLIEGSVSINDLPERWNAAMDDSLGVTPSSDANGVLQDVHWSQGAFGYFPTYTLGTLTAAQLMDAIVDDRPDLRAHIADGDFAPLLDWLRTHVHRHGRILTAPDLLDRATGASLSAAPWLRYARDKFGDIYDLT
ncbi:carboxypeptidase M32 [Salinibacter altiplanensis]|uniref:carboxypeptidase M32 n=1 Tax=Salinibacter altiplanensis TaxID=1803181 RepID=UPI000C9FA7A0|nr:carboxypeptidase M32 [Salinibacter altiplanensis]